MRLKISTKNIFILILVFSIIFCITGAGGYLLWKYNLSVNIDPEVTYILNDTDLTLPVQYTEMTETFILSFIFTFFGICIGFIINTFILFCFILIKLIIDNRGYFEYRYQKYDTEEENSKPIKENINKNNKKEKK